MTVSKSEKKTKGIQPKIISLIERFVQVAKLGSPNPNFPQVYETRDLLEKQQFIAF